MRHIRTAIKYTAAIGLAWFLVMVLLRSAGIRYNLTDSAPLGVYMQSAEGEYIGFCPEGEASRLSVERGYRLPSLFDCPDRHAELIKRVVSHPGDVITVSSDGVSVNERLLPNSAPLIVDTRHRPMPHFPYGTYKVSTSEAWPMSPHPNGFDARYFGPISRGERYKLIWRW